MSNSSYFELNEEEAYALVSLIVSIDDKFNDLYRFIRSNFGEEHRRESILFAVKKNQELYERYISSLEHQYGRDFVESAVQRARQSET
jgi:hypothetical protein